MCFRALARRQGAFDDAPNGHKIYEWPETSVLAQILLTLALFQKQPFSSRKLGLPKQPQTTGECRCTSVNGTRYYSHRSRTFG